MTSRHPSFGGRGSIIWLPVVIILLGLIAASMLISGWILKPIRVIRNSTEKLSSSNLNQKVPNSITKRNDAFGELGREFNLMTSRVLNTIDSQNQLLRDVSHELRSPLARIQVATSLAEKKLGSNPELSRIEKEIDKLNNLIEDLISLSRLNNQHKLEKQNLDLVQLLQNIVEDANFEFQESNKTAKLLVDNKINFSGNKELIHSLFENVIRNALRYTPENNLAQIDVAKSDHRVTIQVSDNGPGVSPEAIGKLFEPFFREDSSRDTSESHHGIGLALASVITSLHDGTITARNIENSGLLVEIQLPTSAG